MTDAKRSRIITFYSYKGGTGRSMALANVAWILASQGKSVLMVDWDLEAPGLHHYFHPFLQDKGLKFSEGIIDLVAKFEEAALAPSEHGANDAVGPDDRTWYLPFADIEKYCVPIAWSFERDGLLDLLPAGKQDSVYAARVNSFNWAAFYDRLGGGVFLEAVKENMRRKYDYILIDSRTGLSDTAGVCTAQMPDTVVVCFTFNTQSIEGAAAVASSIHTQHDRAAKLGKASDVFKIFPVPMRVEDSEKLQLDRAREFAQRAFGGFIEHLPKFRREEYWDQIYVPYQPFYAYQELLATITDESRSRGSMLTSFERLAEFITGEQISERSPASRTERTQLKDIYLRGAQPRNIQEILPRYPEAQYLAEGMMVRQVSWAQSKMNPEFLLSAQRMERIRQFPELLVGMLQDTAFHEFWRASDERLRRRARLRGVLEHIAAGAIVALPLVAIAGSPGISSNYRVITMSGLAGALGSVVASFGDSIRTDPRGDAKLSRGSEIQLALRLLTGIMLGIFIAVLVRPDSAPTAAVLAFGLGLGFRNLVPEIARVERVEKDRGTRK